MSRLYNFMIALNNEIQAEFDVDETNTTDMQKWAKEQVPNLKTEREKRSKEKDEAQKEMEDKCGTQS